MKLGISGSCLLLGGMKIGGAERDTVGVQGPVRGDLLMYGCGVLSIDRSERMGWMAGKVVDVQVT